MGLRIQDSLCCAGGSLGEDVVGSSGNCAWVIDGATGLGEAPLLPHAKSDARWYVEALSEALGEASRALPRAELRRVLRRALETVAARFRREAARMPRELYEHPVAAAALVRVDGARLEYVATGDCRCLVLCPDGLLRTRDPLLGDAEQEIIDASLQLRGTEPELDARATRRRLATRLQALRRVAIEQGIGLSLDPHAAERFMVESIWLEGPSHVLLASDGFYRLVGLFALYTDIGLMSAARRRGLAALYEELRAVEREDGSCRRFPRLKAEDDAAALLGLAAEGGAAGGGGPA